MNFGTALAIGSTLIGIMGGGSRDLPDSEFMGSGSTDGTTSNALGFIRKGLGVYNKMRTGQQTGPQPFKTDVAFKDTGKYYKRFGAGSGTDVSTPTFSGYRTLNPDIKTAIVNLYNNAQNQQMRQLLAQYGGEVAPTLQQGRKTQTTEQASLRVIGV